jgi:hypothetical protein
VWSVVVVVVLVVAVIVAAAVDVVCVVGFGGLGVGAVLGGAVGDVDDAEAGVGWA